jgi:hypothetical protein
MYKGKWDIHEPKQLDDIWMKSCHTCKLESVSKSENVITRAILGLRRQPATGQGGGALWGREGR